MMIRTIFIFLFCMHGLYAQAQTIDVASLPPQADILPYCEIAMDRKQGGDLDTVQSLSFEPARQTVRHFGYAPDFTVWVRCVLYNADDKPMHRTLRYANPLSGEVRFYREEHATPLRIGGLFHLDAQKPLLDPSVTFVLPPHSTQTYYVAASTHVTPLIVRLRLYEPHAFWNEAITRQVVFALLFGALGFVIVYNLLIFAATGDRSYLYYVLFFAAMGFHQLLYRGFAHTYLFDVDTLRAIFERAAFVTLLPALFLSLFMISLFSLEKRYPTLYRILMVAVIAAIVASLLCYTMGWHRYRNIPAIGLLLVIIGVLLVLIAKKERTAMIIALGWVMFVSSAVFMQLSSMGTYDILTKLPYYPEFSLLLEATLFSFVLSARLKRLQREKLAAQAELIAHQRQEEERLTRLVEEKTAKLRKALDEKQLLLKELNHRVKNSLQTILSFARLQRRGAKHDETKRSLTNLENRIYAVDHLHQLFFKQDDTTRVDAAAFIGDIIENIRQSFGMPHIDVVSDIDATLHAKEALYCGLIINEALTNAYQHAFADRTEGRIEVELKEDNGVFRCRVGDNGIGKNVTPKQGSLGLRMMQTLAQTQLGGRISIEYAKGTHIVVTWEREDG